MFKTAFNKAFFDGDSLTGPQREKTCLRRFANNKGADQPAHPRSLISANIIRYLESIISRLTIGEISVFWLVSVADETGLSVALSETPKTGFLTTRPITDCLLSSANISKHNYAV